jgi:hypothetical protein
MISHHIYLCVAQAHRESQMEAARQAHQAQSLRRLARTSRPRRSFLSRIASRLVALNHADAEIAGRGSGAVKYEIALAPGDQHDHAYRPGAATAPGQPLAETS